MPCICKFVHTIIRRSVTLSLKFQNVTYLLGMQESKSEPDDQKNLARPKF